MFDGKQYKTFHYINSRGEKCDGFVSIVLEIILICSVFIAYSQDADRHFVIYSSFTVMPVNNSNYCGENIFTFKPIQDSFFTDAFLNDISNNYDDIIVVGFPNYTDVGI